MVDFETLIIRAAMKKLLYTLLLTCLAFTIELEARDSVSHNLDPFREYLEMGTYEGQDWSSFEKLPLSRYDTFKLSFETFAANQGRTIVELGTSRSFVHGGLPGCNSDNIKYWTPDQPANWDWGAGFFTRMAALSLSFLNPQIHTVDLCKNHIGRCKIMTEDFKHLLYYHVAPSVYFLSHWSGEENIDLLYLDTGDMTPIEPTALLQLEEAQIIVARNLIAPQGLILIDDVKNQTPKKFGETSEFGKAKYSLPFLLENGFEIIAEGYQIVLQKTAMQNTIRN